MSRHEAQRIRRAVRSNATAIRNRIKYFKREEEKIWRDLEDVRRQAAKIEEGRSRALEKKLSEKAIEASKSQAFHQKRLQVAEQKEHQDSVTKQNIFELERQKTLLGEQQRQEHQAILRQKKMQEAHRRLRDSERAVSIQRSQLEAKLRVNQERASRLEGLRADQEAERQLAEVEVMQLEAALPALEQEEMQMLQRLQNSRVVSKSVLEELEASLGATNPVTAALRSKTQNSGMRSGLNHLSADLSSLKQQRGTAADDDSGITPNASRQLDFGA